MLRRYVHRSGSGAFGWHPIDPTSDSAKRPPAGVRVVCEVVTPCPQCQTRGGVKVAGDGKASCANCGERLAPVEGKR